HTPTVAQTSGATFTSLSMMSLSAPHQRVMQRQSSGDEGRLQNLVGPQRTGDDGGSPAGRLPGRKAADPACDALRLSALLQLLLGGQAHAHRVGDGDELLAMDADRVAYGLDRVAHILKTVVDFGDLFLEVQVRGPRLSG